MLPAVQRTSSVWRQLRAADYRCPENQTCTTSPTNILSCAAADAPRSMRPPASHNCLAPVTKATPACLPHSTFQGAVLMHSVKGAAVLGFERGHGERQHRAQPLMQMQTRASRFDTAARRVPRATCALHPARPSSSHTLSTRGAQPSPVLCPFGRSTEGRKRPMTTSQVSAHDPFS